MARAAFAVTVWLLLPLALRADQAIFTDGRHVEGSLRLDKSGALSFVADGKTVDRAKVQAFSLGSSPPPFWRAGPAHLLHLSASEEITGVFLGLERDLVLLRTSWSNRLAVPRTRVLSLTHLPGWRTLRHEPLDSRPDNVSIEGEPLFSRDGLRLTAAGQKLVCPAPREVLAGRVSVNFREQQEPAGAVCAVELIFAARSGRQALQVKLASENENLTVVMEGVKGTTQPLMRTAAERRLSMVFTSGSLRVLVDDAVLWYTLAQGASGPLLEVRLICQGGRGRGNSFSALTLEKQEAWPRRPPAVPDRDELWLASGEQLFGEVVKADGAGIELKARFGRRHFPWRDLLGWYPRRAPDNENPAGLVVRLELHSGLRPSRDVLMGNLVGLDDRQVVLRHRLLGEVTIPRRHIASLRVLATGA